MKKTFYLLIVAVMVITACQTSTKPAPVDTTAAKDDVTKFLEKYHSATNSKDIKTVIPMLANDGLFLGTDSKEFWDKKTLSDMLTQIVSDTTIKMNYAIDKREIRIAADGNSAISIEQLFYNFISRKIPVRLVCHLVKSENVWMIDFLSWALIPNNEDIAKLNKALE
jgi:hypothetical protein